MTTVRAMIRDVISRASLPPGRFTDTEILEMMNEQLSELVIPAIMQVRESYFETDIDIPLTPTVQVYPIPADAMGDKVSFVSYRSGGAERFTELQRYEVSQTASLNGNVQGWRFRGRDIVLTFEPALDSQMRVTYYAEPAGLTIGGTLDAIPKAFAGVLKQATIVKVLESTDSPAFERAQAKLGEVMGAAGIYVAPRAEQNHLVRPAHDSVFFQAGVGFRHRGRR